MTKFPKSNELKSEALPSTAHDVQAPIDPALDAAQQGWGVTLRYGLLAFARPTAVAAAVAGGGVAKALIAFAHVRGWT